MGMLLLHTLLYGDVGVVYGRITLLKKATDIVQSRRLSSNVLGFCTQPIKNSKVPLQND